MIKLLNEFEVHQTLNPAIWDTNYSTLRPEIKDRVLEIVEEFKQYTEVPLSIVDIHILGSMASYNYTKYSDLDVHIVVNYDLMDASKEILQTMYNLAKTDFNKEYDITCHGYNVELYVEDVKSVTISNGIYSLYTDKWIKYPDRLDQVPNVDLEPELTYMKSHIYSAMNMRDLTDIEDMINSLYCIRRLSLATDGEFGKGNLIFKEIRNEGLLDDLKAMRTELKSKQLSLESIAREYLATNRRLNERLLGIDDIRSEIVDEKDCNNYILRTEICYIGDDSIEMNSAYSKIDNSYIGDEDMAKELTDKLNIVPQSYDINNCPTACIGYCEPESKWYGWSHRGMCGFGVGDKVDSEDHLCSGELPVGYECKTLDDCKNCAIVYAKAVA